MEKRTVVPIIVILILFFQLHILHASRTSAATIPIELQNAIESKNKALQEVTNQLQATQQNLIETEERGRTLKKELQRLGYALNQIDLGIKSSQLSIEKLDLEITALQNDIHEAQGSKEKTKKSIKALLQLRREQDEDDALITIFKHRTLAEGINEVEQIHRINTALTEEVKKLEEIQNTLNDNLTELNEKKQQIEFEHRTLKIKKESAEEQKIERQTLLTQTKNQEKLYQQTVEELEKKQLDISGEIEDIENELRTKIDPSLLPKKRPGVLMIPVQGFLSQNFGSTPFARKGGYRGKFHNGIDIAASIGIPIVAAENGVIKKIANQDLFCRKGAYGRYIAIEHNNNLVTLYAHLSAFNKALGEGQTVKRGDIIGYVGKSGYATGPHLHFGVYSKPTFYIGASRSCGPMPYGGYLNPADYL